MRYPVIGIAALTALLVACNGNHEQQSMAPAPGDSVQSQQAPADQAPAAQQAPQGTDGQPATTAPAEAPADGSAAPAASPNEPSPQSGTP